MSDKFVNILTKINFKIFKSKKDSPPTRNKGDGDKAFGQANSFIIPIAAAMIPTGIRRKKPPTSTRHKMNIGTAKTRRIVATIFASPQVILNVSLIALINKTIANIEIIISVILISPFLVIQ